MNLKDALPGFFNDHGYERTYWLAYSGGVDSHVLLSLCADLRAEIPLKINAIHVHHGLSQHADAWAQHCKKICDEYSVAYYEQRIQLLVGNGESLEEQARNNRYAVLASYINAGDFLLTAHHEDDQAETVLLQMLRGAGPKGLSAMPVVKVFSKGFHARPLLNIPRENILAYAVENKLKWIHDESNDDKKFARNFVRHELMPLFRQKWSSAANSIARTAAHCAATQLLADEYAHELLQSVQGSKSNLLSVTKLLAQDVNKQRMLLRAWIVFNDCDIPGTKKLNAILEDVLTAGWDRSPCVEWGHVVLRRYRDDLYLTSRKIVEGDYQEYKWDMCSDLSLPGIGLLISKKAHGGLSPHLKEVTVTFRDSIKNSHRLKNLYQEHGVPPWMRSTTPILMTGDEIISIVGYYNNNKFMSKNEHDGIVVALQ